MTRHINDAGRDLIKKWEGLRLEAYRCPAGVWTIGYGHTGSVAEQGAKITKEHAETLLDADLFHFERCVGAALKRPATDGQFSAFVSLAFNIGCQAFRGSTALRRFNRGDIAGAAEALTWWNKATVRGEKKVLAGLVNRREDERKLFLCDIEQDVAGTADEPESAVEGGNAPDPEQTRAAASSGIAAVASAAAPMASAALGADWRTVAVVGGLAMVGIIAAAIIFRDAIRAKLAGWR